MGAMGSVTFADLLASTAAVEESELRGPFGFMAFHGGGLEEMTDVVARAAATRSGASYYGVLHPAEVSSHIPSHHVTADQSPRLAEFFEHVDTVITIHGYGRRSLLTSLLVGGGNRDLATHTSRHLRAVLPAYDIVDDLDLIPRELRGVHPSNPANVPRQGGIQIELPPRVRGSSPIWWDWEGGLVPHTEALIDGLTAAATTFRAPK